MGEFKETLDVVNHPKEGDDLYYVKKAVLENPERYIGGAIKEILKAEKHLRLTPEGENKFILSILKGLFVRENYWNDEELISAVKKVLVDKKIIKNIKDELVEEKEDGFGETKEKKIISTSDAYKRWQEENGK
ncbi:MAG: hypothetical protein RBS77_06280 [Candidatus Moranbacteria bacterium]|jgi:hypothetical protein|nr:hypothetical protein [Candidatus Moranbacteria bacterium]